MLYATRIPLFVVGAQRVAQYGFQQNPLIEALYEPHQLTTATAGRRLAGYAIDSLLFPALLYASLLMGFAVAGSDPEGTSSSESVVTGIIVTLLIGAFVSWVVWWIVCAVDGQSPAKRMLGMYVMKQDGTRGGFGTMLLRELLIKALLGGLLGAITFGIYSLLAAIWCLWDRDRQCLWDKIGSTYVAHSPHGFKPATAGELWQRGEPPPLLRANQPAGRGGL